MYHKKESRYGPETHAKIYLAETLSNSGKSPRVLGAIETFRSD